MNQISLLPRLIALTLALAGLYCLHWTTKETGMSHLSEIRIALGGLSVAMFAFAVSSTNNANWTIRAALTSTFVGIIGYAQIMTASSAAANVFFNILSAACALAMLFSLFAKRSVYQPN